MTYLEHITTFFVCLVGKGVSLSSRDLALAREWEEAGIPATAACRAIRRGVEGRRRSGRPSLADCAWAVDRLPRTRSENPAGETAEAAPWTPAELQKRIVEAGRAAPDERVKSVYRELYRFVRDLPAVTLTVEAVTRIDDLTLRALEQRLPAHERRQRRQRSSKIARGLLGPTATRSAVARLTSSLLERELCDEYDLVLPSTLLTSEGQA